MMNLISQSTFEARRERVRSKMKEHGLVALLVSDPANRYYLSGFEMGDIHNHGCAGYILVMQNGKDILFTDARYTEAAYRIWDEAHVIIYSSAGEDICSYLKHHVQGNIGLEEFAMPLALYKKLLDGNTFIPADNIVADVRAIKDDIEIALMKKSVTLNHGIMEQIKSLCKEGVREREIAWKIEQYYKNAGATHLSFPSIVAFGKNGALPHYAPEDDNAQLESEMPVLIDCGCVYDGYCSDQTRSFWFGEQPSSEFQKAYALVEEAQRRSIAEIRAGKTCSEIYMVAYNYFEEHGVAQYFTHGLGHGIGVAVHENPRLNRICHTILEPNMVVTVEPGLYYPQWGGIRLEYMVRVCEDGAEIL